MIQRIISVLNKGLPYLLFFGFLLLGLFIYYLLTHDKSKREKMPSKKRMLTLPKEELGEVKLQFTTNTKEEIVKDEVPLVTSEEATEFSAIKYNYSYFAHLSIAPLASKERYNIIKNAFLTYQNVKSSITWREERFIFNGKTIAKVRVIGNVMRLYLALPYELMATVNIKSDDLSNVKEHSVTPSLIRISGNTGVKRAKEVITLLATHQGLNLEPTYTEESYLPPETTFTELLNDGHIRSV